MCTCITLLSTRVQHRICKHFGNHSCQTLSSTSSCPSSDIYCTYILVASPVTKANSVSVIFYAFVVHSSDMKRQLRLAPDVARIAPRIKGFVRRTMTHAVPSILPGATLLRAADDSEQFCLPLPRKRGHPSRFLRSCSTRSCLLI